MKEDEGSQRISERISSWVVNVLLVLTVVPLLFSAVLLTFGVKTMYVVSNSMSPTFDTGSLVLVSKDYGSLAIGDVVAFKAEWFSSRIVTHRIVSIEEDGKKGINRPSGLSRIFTKGDNNDVRDPEPTEAGNVVGEVVGSVPYLGYYVNGRTLAAMVVILNVLVFLPVVRRLFIRKAKTPAE